MKRIFISMCAAVFALSVCAMPQLSQKAQIPAQTTGDGGINSLTAFSMENMPTQSQIDWMKGDFQLMLSHANSDGSETVAACVYITTHDSVNNAIAGVYSIGTSNGGNGIPANVYVGDTIYRILNGTIAIECMGDTTISQLKCPLYKITAFGWVSDNKETISDFEAIVVGSIVDKKQYEDNPKDPSKWFISCTDKKLETIKIEAELYAYKDSTTKKGYMNFMGFGQDYGVVVYALTKNLLGAQNNLYIDDTLATVVFPMDGGKAIAIKRGYGYNRFYGKQYEFNYFLFAQDGRIFHAIVSTVYDPFGYDNTASNFTMTTNLADLLYYEDTKRMNVFMYNESLQAASVDFYIDNIDPTIVIPAGTYTISDTKAAGTVLASSGEDKAGDLTGSFGATLNTSFTPTALWYITSGTVTVTNQDGALSIVVNGTNSKGKTVTINCTKVFSALEDVEAAAVSAQKVLENGQIVVIRNGVRYNLQGAVIR